MAFDWSKLDRFVNALKEQSLNEAVVCGGSQNAPLIWSLKKNGFPLHHSFDERSAAFFALGLSRASSKAVAVVCTSGSAVAECLPALLEAKHTETPLILISCDRDKEFENTGFPQITQHLALTQGWLKSCLDLHVDSLSQFTLSTNEPQHINLRLSDPSSEIDHLANMDKETLPSFIDKAKNLLILVGELRTNEERELVQSFLSRIKAPTYLESLSGLRSHLQQESFVLQNSSCLNQLNTDDWSILKIGAAPVHKFWRDLIRKESYRNFPVYSLSLNHEGHLPESRLCGKEPLSALSSIQTQERQNSAEELSLLKSSKHQQQDSPEASAIRSLAKLIPENASLFLGNSLAIRLWDTFNDMPQKRLHHIAQRGINGIDGQISHFLGHIHALQKGSPAPLQSAWALLGDLTCLYDTNGLDFLSELKTPIRLVLLDNQGGKIFEKLPYFKEKFGESESSKLLLNTHSKDWSLLAKLWGMDYCEGLDNYEDTPAHTLIRVDLS